MAEGEAESKRPRRSTPCSRKTQESQGQQPRSLQHQGNGILIEGGRRIDSWSPRNGRTRGAGLAADYGEAAGGGGGPWNGRTGCGSPRNGRTGPLLSTSTGRGRSSPGNGHRRSSSRRNGHTRDSKLGLRRWRSSPRNGHTGSRQALLNKSPQVGEILPQLPDLSSKFSKDQQDIRRRKGVTHERMRYKG